MNIDRLKEYREGDKINIQEGTFEIVRIEKGKEPEKKSIVLKLRNIRDKSFSPTAELKVYDDGKTKEMKFSMIEQKKEDSAEGFKFEKRGQSISYREEKY